MNATAHTDEPYDGEGLNQSPSPFSSDLTCNQDFNGRANRRRQRLKGLGAAADDSSRDRRTDDGTVEDEGLGWGAGSATAKGTTFQVPQAVAVVGGGGEDGEGGEEEGGGGGWPGRTLAKVRRMPAKTRHALWTFMKFIGPGFMIAVAYIDPGNYSTDIAAGASYRFKLLFVVFLSNLFAILLQSLAIRLGTVTGLDLASACREFLPRWLNIALYVLAEIAIIATDIAEVIGTAIALNLLIPQLPLVAGCALSIVDVMFILIFYRPNGAMKGLRSFEIFVCCLVLGVVICFCIQLSLIKDAPAVAVLRGFLPSGALVQSTGLYQSCGILGATVMPHSLFLGSGIVQPRLREYDTKHGLLPPLPPSSSISSQEDMAEKTVYVPSHAAIKHSLKYSIAELSISLFTFAMFVNSAILIVGGASIYNNPEALTASIFGIHKLLSTSISPAAGIIFSLALLLSGVSAGIICTIAGQMVSEGALRWKTKPWMRRLITRSISITPSIIIAGAVGRSGLDAALNGSQVALSTILPFVSLPLIYFTCRNRYMTARPGMAQLHLSDRTARRGETRAAEAARAQAEAGAGDEHRAEMQGGQDEGIKMANSWLVCIISGLVWLLIAVMNTANLVLLGRGDSS